VLQQRRSGRQREKGWTNRRRQPTNQPKHRKAVGGRCRLRQIKRQEGCADRQHNSMDRGLREATEPGNQKMRIGVAEKQCRLEKADCRVPHTRRSAEPRQHHLGDHWLDQEQQTGAEEQCRGIARQQQPPRIADDRGDGEDFGLGAHGFPQVVAEYMLRLV